jgi:serine/threonine protein kinase
LADGCQLGTQPAQASDRTTILHSLLRHKQGNWAPYKQVEASNPFDNHPLALRAHRDDDAKILKFVSDVSYTDTEGQTRQLRASTLIGAFDSYAVGSTIVSGSYGAGALALNSKGETVFIKTLRLGPKQDAAGRALRNHFGMPVRMKTRISTVEGAMEEAGKQNSVDKDSVRDVVERANKLHVVMDYLPNDGFTFLDNLNISLEAAGDNPWQRELVVIRLLRQTSAALARVHAAGLIHFDLKYENILVSSTGELRVADFGHAHHVDPATQGVIIRSAGTLMMMSPEAVCSRIMPGISVGQKTDMWAVGVMGYQAFMKNAWPFSTIAGAQEPYEVAYEMHEEYQKWHESLFVPMPSSAHASGNETTLDPRQIAQTQGSWRRAFKYESADDAGMVQNLLTNLLHPDPEKRIDAQSYSDIAQEAEELYEDAATRDPDIKALWDSTNAIWQDAAKPSDSVQTYLDALRTYQRGVAELVELENKSQTPKD